MPALSIRIIRANDIAEGAPAVLPRHGKILEGEIVQMIGLERGMVSGLPSVAIMVQLADGQVVFAETSYRLFKIAADALAAAKLAGADA